MRQAIEIGECTGPSTGDLLAGICARPADARTRGAVLRINCVYVTCLDGHRESE